jgi:2-hydroxychromene-2-carboxylate isomerase
VKVIVYGDFNSLYCYLASRRADRLVREGKADVEWCAVEYRPRLPVTGAKPPPCSVGAQDDLAEAHVVGWAELILNDYLATAIVDRQH